VRKKIPLNHKGFTLIELLVSLVVGSIVILSASKLYFSTVQTYHDRRIKTEADETANTILQMMVFDIRNAGNEIPDVMNWNMSSGLADDYIYPLLAVNSTSSNLQLHMSDSATCTVLVADYDASAGMDVEINDSLLSAGDIITINGIQAGYENALSGTINKVLGSGPYTATLATSTYSGTPIFPDGSYLCQIKVLIYTSNPAWTGIYFDDGEVGTIVAANTTFSVAYLDVSGAVVAMSNSNVRNTITTLELTVYARGAKSLIDGSTYTAWAKQQVAIRHLLSSRYQSW